MRILFLMICLSFSTVAVAQSAGDKEQAKSFFNAGQKLYKQKKYAAAEKKFKKAHAILPLKAFLFNIGQCQFQTGQYQEAAKNYREYLVENEDAPNYELVQQYILEANARHEAKQAQLETEELKVKAAAAEKKAAEAADLAKNAKSLIGAAKGEAEAAAREAEEARNRVKQAEQKRLVAEQDRKKIETARIEAEKRLEEERNSIFSNGAVWGTIGVGAGVVAVGALVGAGVAGALAYLDFTKSNGTLGEPVVADAPATIR